MDIGREEEVVIVKRMNDPTPLRRVRRTVRETEPTPMLPIPEREPVLVPAKVRIGGQ